MTVLFWIGIAYLLLYIALGIAWARECYRQRQSDEPDLREMELMQKEPPEASITLGELREWPRALHHLN